MTDITAWNENEKKKKMWIAERRTDLEDRENGRGDSKRQQKQETRNSNLTESAEPLIWTWANYAIPVRTDGTEHKQKQQGNNWVTKL